MATQLKHQPKQAKVVHHLTWEQLEEFDRSLEDFAGVKLGYLPDESFSIGARNQYPDLVFEVTVTSGGIDRLEGY